MKIRNTGIPWKKPISASSEAAPEKYSSEGRGSKSDFKAIEMRIRRTVGKAMKNIAAMGIEDFSNDKFVLYSSSLFDYVDVKAEMDYIRGKAKYNGKVNIKSFIKRLLVMLEQIA